MTSGLECVTTAPIDKNAQFFQRRCRRDAADGNICDSQQTTLTHSTTQRSTAQAQASYPCGGILTLLAQHLNDF